MNILLCASLCIFTTLLSLGVGLLVVGSRTSIWILPLYPQPACSDGSASAWSALCPTRLQGRRLISRGDVARPVASAGYQWDRPAFRAHCLFSFLLLAVHILSIFPVDLSVFRIESWGGFIYLVSSICSSTFFFQLFFSSLFIFVLFVRVVHRVMALAGTPQILVLSYSIMY